MSLDELNIQILACRQCPRLVTWRETVARNKRKAYLDWEYWGRPVPGFGDPHARVLVVGLAPGAHGSNRTGRQFTGDASGDFLYPALFRAGFASRPESVSRDDGLTLNDLYLTASARCAPPQNKPTSQELHNCRPFLQREIELLQPRVIVCLGRIAFDSVLRLYAMRNPAWKFAHGAVYRLEAGPWLVCSYHPSQQNTRTGRLTLPMFDALWARVKSLLDITEATTSAERSVP
ncbi:MAG: type-5 uracil-DNA glycosylase [Anaerolineales bacterium]